MDLNVLLDCGGFNDFLIKSLALQYSKKKRVNYSDFSMRAGFASRSYLTELLKGKKGLSHDSLMKIKSGLKLPKSYLALLELLALQDYPELRPKTLTIDLLNKKLTKARRTCRAKRIEKGAVHELSSLAGRSETYQVYASLGSEEKGASLDQIHLRSRLPEKSIEKSLELLIKENIVEKKEERFYAKANSLSLFGLKSDEGLSELFGQVCRQIIENRKQLTDDETNSIFYTSFSMNECDFVRFKVKMKEAIFSVVEEFQEDDGDSVRQLFFSSFTNLRNL